MSWERFPRPFDAQRADKRTGVCLMPQFEIMSLPFYIVREDDSQGTTHGQSQWQETPQRVRRREEKVPLCNDGRKMKRIGRPRTVHGWTGECCRYRDNLALIDTSYIATWKERSRCENSLVFKLNDGPHPERMTSREDFPPEARALGALQRHQGRVNPHIPKNEREQHSPKNCDQILSSKVGIGKSTGRRHHSSSGKWHEPEQQNWR